MLRVIGFAILMLIALAGAGLAQGQPEEHRIALVIGNAAYQADPLASTANDAGLVAQTLQAAGFDVVGARDLDAAAMRASFREFLAKAASSGPDTVALVYFSGYGVQFEGENYLVPVDARIAHDSDVPLEAVRLADLTTPLAGIPLKARIVVLDAARANRFGDAGHPLAGGLALVQPDPGMLIAFNAAPGTIAPDSTGAYGDYATALTEMIKQGGLPLGQLFDQVRLRVGELTKGAELAWYASRIEAPFLFFERTAAAPQPDRFSQLMSRPVRDFDAHDAYLAALARDTMRGYEDFLAAYPHDPLARRVRAILAARREAVTWHESVMADTPDAYWSYLQRYPRGPHAYAARRRLAHFDAALEPPTSFSVIVYDVPPPPPDEIVYLVGPVVYFWDPDYDLPPPPVVPVIFLPPPPAYFVDYPPPPPPIAEFVLPVPVYYPVATWVVRPPYVAPPPVNIININIHNKVVINEADRTAVVTDPAGHQVPPLPADLLPRQPVAQGNAHPHLVQAHPAATAAVAAAVAALPVAVAHRAQKMKKPQSPPAAEKARQPVPAAPQQAQGHPFKPLPGIPTPGISRQTPATAAAIQRRTRKPTVSARVPQRTFRKEPPKQGERFSSPRKAPATARQKRRLQKAPFATRTSRGAIARTRRTAPFGEPRQPVARHGNRPKRQIFTPNLAGPAVRHPRAFVPREPSMEQQRRQFVRRPHVHETMPRRQIRPVPRQIERAMPRAFPQEQAIRPQRQARPPIREAAPPRETRPAPRRMEPPMPAPQQRPRKRQECGQPGLPRCQ